MVAGQRHAFSMSSPDSTAPRATEMIALGEVMLRLSPPGHGRLEFARSLDIDVGGGEYNVAYALARLGHSTGFVTQLPDNELGRIILQHARGAGMSTEHIRLQPFDGVGRNGRVGLYFAEIGMGPRGGLAVFDRAGSDASRMQPGDVDWDAVMTQSGWFHCSGIFPVLSENCRSTLRVAVAAARRHNVPVSYDLNYRSKLCTPEAAAEVNREMAAAATLLLGSPEGFAALLGARESGFDPDDETGLIQGLTAVFPGVQAIGATRRVVRSGSCHDLSGWLWSGGTLCRSRVWSGVEIEDRVGSGDAFAAGLIHGRLRGWPALDALEFGVAHAVLLQTTRGDTSQFTEADVAALLRDGTAAMKR